MIIYSLYIYQLLMEAGDERITYTINDWDIRDVARLGCEPSMAYPGEWRTALFEYGIKEKP